MADGLLQHQTAVIKEACLQSALLLKTASFLHFRLPQEPHFIIWDEMGQEKGSRQGRARKHPFVLQSGTCTRLGDLSQAADELVPGGGGGVPLQLSKLSLKNITRHTGVHRMHAVLFVLPRRPDSP